MSHQISIEINREVAMHIQNYLKRKTDVSYVLDPEAVQEFSLAVDDAIAVDDAEED